VSQDLTSDIASLTGARPSRPAVELLHDWLLPQEPFVAGVAGWSGISRVFLLSTPVVLVVVHDGAEVSLEPLVFSQLSGWELAPGWRGPTFTLGTLAGLVKVSGVDATAAQQLVFAMERLSQEAPDGAPVSLMPLADAFDELASATLAATGGGPAGEAAALERAARAAMAVCGDAVRQTGGLTMDMGLALSWWSVAAGLDISGGRGATVRRVLNTTDPATQAADLEVLHVGRDEDRRRTCRALADVVMAFAGSLPLSERTSREVFATAAQRTLDAAPQAPVELGRALQPPTAPTGGGHNEVVDQLERLAALRSTGAITDDEFDTMKARLLALP
jgi:hypothetical protein